MKSSSLPWLRVLTLAGVFVVAGAAAALAADPTVTATGTVASINGDSVVLTTQNGDEKTVTLAPGTLVLGRVEASRDDIAVGQAMGVDAQRRPDGSLRAVVINIFTPELWKVVRKGQWPMESGDVMTNAVVTQAAVASMDAGSMTLKYQNITAVISLPADTKVNRLVTMQQDSLQPGVHVMVRGTAGNDGSIKAASVFEDQTGKG